jgi:hypothetical protein
MFAHPIFARQRLGKNVTAAINTHSTIDEFWLSLQPPAHAGYSFADFSTLKMEAIRSSEMSVYTRSTQRHIPEDGILHSHRCENLKSYKYYVVGHYPSSYVYLNTVLCGDKDWLYRLGTTE